MASNLALGTDQLGFPKLSAAPHCVCLFDSDIRLKRGPILESSWEASGPPSM